MAGASASQSDELRGLIPVIALAAAILAAVAVSSWTFDVAAWAMAGKTD